MSQYFDSLFILFVGIFHFLNPIFGLNERQRVFRVPESLTSGQHIGFVRGENGEPLEAQEKQNFFIVFPPDGNDTFERIIQVNERTGEISVRSGQSLDREVASKMQILAIPVDGNEPIEIRIEILDENDNSPIFPVDSIRVEISEYARINTEMSLPKAKDADEGKYGIQRYRIASGNVNNAFRLSYNPDLFLDLVVNGQLDREYRAKYELMVEAIDGGKPPKIGKLRVEVDVLDANDNPPEFMQSHYSTRIGPNVGPGIPILRVTAKDQDEGENGQIEYSIASQSIIEPHQMLAPSSTLQIQMQIDPKSGAISLQNPLPPTLHGPIIFELVICAKDKGISNPLEATATVQIVIEGNDEKGKSSMMGIMHRIGLIWLTENGSPENVPEELPLGQLLARALVEGHSEEELDELKLSLLGGQSVICLRQTDSGNIYLLVVCGQLDHEKMEVLQMDLLLRRGIGGDVLVDLPIHFTLKDVNDNSPIWNSTNFQFEWALGGNDEAEGRRLVAKDEDSGENGRIEYKLMGTDLFEIDEETGELWLRKEKQIPFCLSDGGLRINFQVEAIDQGNPPLSARTNVSILLMPEYSNESSRIHFGQSLYELTISEDIQPGTCIFQISAVDNSLCPGQNASNLNYWLSEGEFSGFFKLDTKTGILCTKKWLDAERDGNIIELEAMAGNGDGSEANAQLLIRLEDVNDNSPIFHPREYALLLSPDGLDPSKILLRVRAIDKDQSAKFNQINYEMGQGIGAELFKIGRQNGELRLTELGAKKLGMVEEGQIGMHGMELRVEAKDSGGRRSEEMAIIRVRLLPTHFHCISFSERIYRFKVSEETLPGIGIGQLRVEEVADPEKVRFEIVRKEGKEQNALFGFDEMHPNQLILEGELDADVAGGDEYLLNIKAIDGIKNCTNYTQISVEILDTNDNGPEFSAKKVRIELAEDQPIHVPFYVIKAMDKDRGEQNGRISYELVGIRLNNSLLPILVHSQTGAISLSAQLDVDEGGNSQHYWIGLRAFDHGMPARKAEMELEMVVLDVNDNGPKFLEEEYSIEVEENAEIGQILLRVEAKDADKSKENSRIQYGISQIRPAIKEEEEDEPILRINARNGEIFLRHQIDREKCKEYLFELRAMDGGNPPRNGTAQLRIGVLDLNDNAPNCTKKITKLELRVGQKAGEMIGRIEAEDGDEGPNGAIRFRMQQPNNGIFQMAANGDIFLMEDLNDELMLIKIMREMNSFLVIAEDQPTNSTPLSTICQVSVQNGNGTIREKEELMIGQMVEEERIIELENGMDVGTELMTMNSSNGIETKWSVESGNEYFMVGPKRKLLLAKKIEGGGGIIDGTKLTIRLEDGEGKNLKLFKFRVKMKDERILEISIPANWTIHSKKAIYQMERESSANYSKLEFFYRIEGDDEKSEKIVDSGLVELDELSGQLFIVDWPSSYSYESSISLRIMAHPLSDGFVEENIGHKNEQRIRVEMDEWIKRRMEAKMRPKCEKLFDQWNISELTTIGNFIGQVNGIGDELLHFELAEGNNDELFGIGAKSGKIYINGKLDWRKAKRHILTIKISSRNGNSGKRLTTKCIRIVNIENDYGKIKSPKFLSRPNVTIFMANFEKGLYGNRGNVIHHFVVDKKPNEFQIIGSSKEDAPFQIDPKNGALSMLANAPVLIPSNVSSVQLTIKASISPSNFGEQNFTIYFDHFGRRQFAYFDRPQFLAELQMEGAQKQFVANFGRKDGPENVEFLLLPSLPGFSFEDFGNLFYSPPPNGQQKMQQNLTIIVIARLKNSSHHFDHSQLNILPIRRGIGPKIEPTSCGNLSIPEGMRVDNLLKIRLLGEEQAKEGESTIVFGIEGGNWHSLFSINPKNGWLSCRELDREAKAEHFLMISATDFGTLPRKGDVCSVRIEVIDRNDNAPKLVGIAEKQELPIDAKIGHILGKMKAEDGDEGKNGEIIFEMENDTSGMFDLDPETGELSFERETAYLRENSGVWINIRAIDEGRPKWLSSETKRIRIEWGKRKIEGKLNLAFSRRKYVAHILEGMPKGQMLMKLDLVNVDEDNGNSPLSLSIVSGNLDSAFQIDESAKLWTNLELDAEIRLFYSLQILAFSGNEQRAECRVDIRVIDREDNWPTIRRQNGPIKLNENTPIGTQIARIGANDIDSDWVEYSILNENSNEGEYFEIGRWTGRIHLAKELDYEAKRRHELQIEASDGIHHCSVANLSIEVLDANDNVPQFMNPFLELELPKNAQTGTLLAKLEAKDGDGTKMNGKINYELVGAENNGNDGANLLALDRITGELRLKRKPTIIKEGIIGGFEQQFFTVKAIDSGNPPLFSFCTIRIGSIIVDSNIHHKIGPIFSSPTFSFSISSAEYFPPKMPIGQLHLLHPSRLPLNCDFGLHFPANSSSNPFRIDFDGTIFLDEILEPEMKGEWIDLEATISECPPPLIKTSNAARTLVRIKIVDENEKWPEFDLGNLTQQILIGQSTAKGKLLAKINSKNSSMENFNKIYSILAGNDFGMFKMDGEKGELNFGHWNDEFGKEIRTKMNGNNSIELVICAIDLEYPERKTVKLLKILVENETMSAYLNENVPTFGVPIYRKFVEENTPPGAILFTVKIAEEENKKNKWKYSIDEIGGEWNETVSMDPSSGQIILTAPLDLEGSQNDGKNPIKFNVIARNEQETFEAKVPAEIYLIGVDEFAPKFTKNAYTFQLPQNPQIGQQFGQILATDEDIGIGNRIKYSLDPADLIAAHFVSIDPSNGSLALIRMPPSKDGGGNGSGSNVFRFTVWAQSMQMAISPMKRANAIVFVEIGSSNSPPPQIASSPSSHQFIPLLLFPFLLLLICFLSAPLLAKLLLHAQNLPHKSQPDADFLRPTPKKRVFTVSACRQLQLEQQRQLGMEGTLYRGFSYSFESGQFSQQNNANIGPKSTNYMNIVDSSGNNNQPMPSGGSRRSQPDSGIDPDRISKGSEQSDGIGLANEYLQKLGIKERNEPSEDASSFLDELIYAPLEELFGPDESNGEMWRRRKEPVKHENRLGQPILICGEKRRISSEMIIPFKPLSQVLSQMEEEAKRAVGGDGSRV